MAHYNNIYVNLNHLTSAYGILDEYGVMICDNISKAGGRTNPLNLKQFREYLYYDHGINQTYYIKGKVVVDTYQSSNIGSLGLNSLFETPHNKKNIKLINWEDVKQDVQDPWSIIVSGTNASIGSDVQIISNNDNLEICNGEIEVSGTFNRMTFGIMDYSSFLEELDPWNSPGWVDVVSGSTDNTLSIINTKLYSDVETDIENDVYSLSFLNFYKISVINSIITDKNKTGSVFVNNSYFYNTNCYFINDVFYNINYFIGFPNNTNEGNYNISTYYNNCVFTEPVSAYEQTSATYYNIFNVSSVQDYNTQFEWAGASACSASVMNLSQSADFKYLDSDWVSIALSGLSATLWYNNDVDKEYCVREFQFTKYRDGIGALTFTELEDVFVNTLSAGDGIVSAYNSSGAIYDATNSPGIYKWTFYEQDEYVSSASSAFDITHTYTTPGIRDVEMDVYSHNSWYKKSNINQTYFDASNIAYNMAVYVEQYNNLTGKYYTIPLDSEGNLSGYTFDNVKMVVNNASIYDVGTKTFESWGSDFSEEMTFDAAKYWEDNVNENSYAFGHVSGYPYEVVHKYTSPGFYKIYFATKTIDGDVSASYKTLVIHDKSQDEYYVDLDEYYEKSGNKWIYKRSGITDDFEDGFNSEWESDFTTDYSIVDMWDNNCASNTVGGMTTMFTSLHYSLDFEWEFVRTRNSPIPYIWMVNDGETYMKVSWDYDNDRLDFVSLELSASLIYNLRDWGYTKDLDCNNSLRSIGIRIVTVPSDEGWKFEIYVKFRDEWINYTAQLFSYDYFTESSFELIAYTSNGVGFGYMQLQSHWGLPYYNGSTAYPLTFYEFRRMTEYKYNDLDVVREDMPTADYTTRFLLKNYVKTTEPYKMLPDRHYNIDAWELSAYGPWMIVWDIQTDNISEDEKDVWVISFESGTLSNGIMYNIRETTYGGWVIPNLELSFTYDMLVVWNSEYAPTNKYEGHIRLVHNKIPGNTFHNKYNNIIGNTIKSEQGFISFDS